MASSGYLVSPKKDVSKEKLWTETWKRIDRFLPDLRSDLALEEPLTEEEKIAKTQRQSEAEPKDATHVKATEESTEKQKEAEEEEEEDEDDEEDEEENEEEESDKEKDEVKEEAKEA